MKIACALSVPRFGCMDNTESMLRAFVALGIPPKRYAKNAYWHQSLEICMEQLCEEDVDAILTVDMDTVFTIDMLLDLTSIFEANPWIDCLMPIQQRRGGADIPLYVCRDPTSGICAPPQPDARDERVGVVQSGHFGLTLIRTASLKRMPHPWFFDLPTAAGKWRDDPDATLDTGDPMMALIQQVRAAMGLEDGSKLDNDIWFWKRWQQHGNNLCLAREVTVGHLQSVITMPTARTHQDYNLDPDAFFEVMESRQADLVEA